MPPSAVNYKTYMERPVASRVAVGRWFSKRAFRSLAIVRHLNHRAAEFVDFMSGIKNLVNTVCLHVKTASAVTNKN